MDFCPVTMYQSKILQVEVLRIVISCSIMKGYKRFSGHCCLHLQGEVCGAKFKSLCYWWSASKFIVVSSPFRDSGQYFKRVESDHYGFICHGVPSLTKGHVCQLKVCGAGRVDLALRAVGRRSRDTCEPMGRWIKPARWSATGGKWKDVRITLIGNVVGGPEKRVFCDGKKWMKYDVHSVSDQ